MGHKAWRWLDAVLVARCCMACVGAGCLQRTSSFMPQSQRCCLSLSHLNSAFKTDLHVSIVQSLMHLVTPRFPSIMFHVCQNPHKELKVVSAIVCVSQRCRLIVHMNASGGNVVFICVSEDSR